jgi:hypothetical protein
MQIEGRSYNLTGDERDEREANRGDELVSDARVHARVHAADTPIVGARASLDVPTQRRLR